MHKTHHRHHHHHQSPNAHLLHTQHFEYGGHISCFPIESFALFRSKVSNWHFSSLASLLSFFLFFAILIPARFIRALHVLISARVSRLFWEMQPMTWKCKVPLSRAQSHQLVFSRRVALRKSILWSVLRGNGLSEVHVMGNMSWQKSQFPSVNGALREF